MKKISVYQSDFESQNDWNDFLEELEYPEEERILINEVELSVSDASVPDTTIEKKQF